MLFTYGDVQKLAGKDWLPLELRSEKSVEIYLRRLVRTVSGIFKEEPAEIYVPLKSRDLDEFELQEGPFIYVRSDYFIGLVRLKKVWGVVGLVTKGDSKLLKDTLRVGDDYVQQLMLLERQEEERREKGLQVGAGVRILDGTYRDFCATVTACQDQAVTVVIDMAFRRVELKTWRHNLRVVSKGPFFVAAPIQSCWVSDYLSKKEQSNLDTEAAE